MAAHSAAAIRSQRDDGRVMSELFHTRTARGRAPRGRAPPTVRALIDAGARRLARARVYFGHGTDNARDESAALVLHALKLPHAASGALYRRRVGAAAAQRARALIARRIRERIPAVYLTGVTGFAGLRFCVDPRVLIPRSPIAELIERGFAPWLEPARVRRVLDLGTGSGCIAIAAARALPRARVDAVDISAAALAVAATNVRRHRLQSARAAAPLRSLPRSSRAHATISSSAIRPTWGRASCARLPPEYRHEPRVALAAGPRRARLGARHPARGRRSPEAAAACWSWKWATASTRCGAPSRGCPSCGWHSSAAAAGFFCLTREQLTKH